MLRQDYIGRLIAQVAEALARALGKLKESKLEEAEQELAEAENSLALPRGIERFDARSAALIIGNGDKVVLAALLLERRAELARARGKADEARRGLARARALLEHARPHELATEAEALRARLGGEP
ncbi:MAG: hypothetical protein U0263_28470 [Polyangiaceae bacterium]